MIGGRRGDSELPVGSPDPERNLLYADSRDRLLSSGQNPGETDVQRGKRRIVVGYMVIGTPPRLTFGLSYLSEGQLGRW